MAPYDVASTIQQSLNGGEWPGGTQRRKTGDVQPQQQQQQQETPPPPPKPARGPPNPFYRAFLLLKLNALYALAWVWRTGSPKTAKTVSEMSPIAHFAALPLAVVMVASSVLGLRWAGGKVGAARAAARPAVPSTVLYSHFVKDLNLKKVQAVRFEAGRCRLTPG